MDDGDGELYITGLGVLSPVAAPVGTRCFWTAAPQTVSGVPDVSVSVFLTAEDVTSFDDGFAAGIVGLLPELLQAARTAVLAAHEISPPGPACVVLGGPDVVFGASTEWTVRFSDTTLPECGELGSLVFFDGRAVTGVDNLADAEHADF